MLYWCYAFIFFRIHYAVFIFRWFHFRCRCLSLMPITLLRRRFFAWCWCLIFAFRFLSFHFSFRFFALRHGHATTPQCAMPFRWLMLLPQHYDDYYCLPLFRHADMLLMLPLLPPCCYWCFMLPLSFFFAFLRIFRRHWLSPYAAFHYYHFLSHYCLIIFAFYRHFHFFFITRRHYYFRISSFADFFRRFSLFSYAFRRWCHTLLIFIATFFACWCHFRCCFSPLLSLFLIFATNIFAYFHAIIFAPPHYAPCFSLMLFSPLSLFAFFSFFATLVDIAAISDFFTPLTLSIDAADAFFAAADFSFLSLRYWLFHAIISPLLRYAAAFRFSLLLTLMP